jgi:hypothetical protein
VLIDRAGQLAVDPVEQLTRAVARARCGQLGSERLAQRLGDRRQIGVT